LLIYILNLKFIMINIALGDGTINENCPGDIKHQSSLNILTILPPMISQVSPSNIKLSGFYSQEKTYFTVDSEWDSLSKQWICTQVLVKKYKTSYLYLFCWENIPNKERIAELCRDYNANFIAIDSPDNILPYLMDTLEISGKADLRIYYSAKDIEHFIGKETAKEIYLKKLEKKRCIKGSFITKSSKYSLTSTCKDAVGWSNTGGLKGLAEAVGVKMVNKSSMDKYKENMLKGAEEDPEGFVPYVLDDVIKLDEIFYKYPDLVNYVEVEVLGIPEEKAFTPDNIPMTQGSTVAKSFKKWLYSRSSQPDMLKFAIRKLGILKLNQSSKKLNEDLKAFAWANQSWVVERLEKEKDNPLLKHFLEKCTFEQVAYSGATIPILAKHPYKDSTACFNAIVQGGRCNNEIPSLIKILIALDIDLQSAYGSALRSLIYPVGLPRGWSYSPNEEKITLGQFLKKNEKNFVPGLWQIVVKGVLSFRQDLVFSKDVSGSDINRASVSEFDREINSETEDPSHIPGVFCLLRSEIVNGHITADILEVIRKVSSNIELGQWMKLEVVCALGWFEKDRCVDEADFINKVLAEENISANGVKGKVIANQGVEENRPAYWYAVPLEEFIGKLVDTRGEFKKQGKAGDTSAAAKQQALKLFINTLYGVFASPYFNIGNAVLANNITARARVGAWLVSKALILRQTITDGGLYTPTGVAFFEGKKTPGFTILNDMTLWKDWKKERYIKPLGGINWEEKFEEFNTLSNGEIQSLVDKLASEHIENFWQPYGLSLKKFFNIEHKVEHTANVAAYLCKGHYAVDLLKPLEEDGKLKERLYRVRGAIRYDKSTNKGNVLIENPIFEVLDCILDGRDIPNISSFEYDNRHLLSLSEWQEAQSSNGYENYKLLMPGDEVVDKRIFRLNNNYFSVDTLKEYLSRYNRKKEISRGGINSTFLWFEKYLEKGMSIYALKAEENIL
jgi:hypothetical protein